MSIMLTTSYQELSRLNFNYFSIVLYGKYTSQDTINNYSSLSFKTVFSTGQNTVSFSRAEAWLDASRRDYPFTTMYKGDTLIQEVTRPIEHNQDGSSPTREVPYSWYDTFTGSYLLGKANIIVPKIDRLPEITSGENFNDESNPVIYFRNPAGFTCKPYMKFFNTYNNSKVLYSLSRNTNATSPYTWNITSSEREAIRKTLTNDKTFLVEEGFNVYKSDGSLLTSVDVVKNFYIINAEPSVRLNIVETNQSVINYYGTSANTIVKNVSKLNLTSTNTLKKYATLAGQTYTYNGRNDNTTSATGVVPTSNYFEVIISDSRGYRATTSKTLTMEDYIPISIDSFDFKRKEPTSSEILLDAEITYFQHTYNGIANKNNLYYTTKGSAWKKIPEASYTIDTSNNKIHLRDYKLAEQIPYTQSERFYILVEDIFTSDEDNEIVPKGIPTFDAGENDVKVNGDLIIANSEGVGNFNVRNEVNNKVNDVFMGANPNINSIDFRIDSGMYGIYNCTTAPSMDIGILTVYAYSQDWAVQEWREPNRRGIWQRSFTNGKSWNDWTKIA